MKAQHLMIVALLGATASLAAGTAHAEYPERTKNYLQDAKAAGLVK